MRSVTCSRTPGAAACFDGSGGAGFVVTCLNIASAASRELGGRRLSCMESSQENRCAILAHDPIELTVIAMTAIPSDRIIPRSMARRRLDRPDLFQIGLAEIGDNVGHQLRLV